MPRNPFFPRQLNELSATELLGLVTQLQLLVYQDEEGDWDPDRECDSETLGEISNLLQAYGLAPLSPQIPPPHQES
ncbi:hypothetical protein [Planctellipticum variicoloris]|uniref:hypothetical protein n=1 Tax=Planctellipticum variicoloris TaxID=3064265 RepID=UPI003013453A|nr:hypothetical protein SH412_005309 [Planctomycetaceae bacterium SH412]